MDSRKNVLKDVAILAAGELILTAVMVGIFAALGYFKMNVLWGALTGCLVMILNHLFLAITVTLATEKAAQENDHKSAQIMIQLSGFVRLLLIGAVSVVAIKLGANVLAVLLPLAFARPVLMVAGFFRKKGD